MTHYDIFREQLAAMYPGFGHALWDPEPMNPDRPVQVGDVGFIRTGKFHRLFNALLPADDPSHEFGVPEDHEPLAPVSVEADPGHYSNSPDDSDFWRTAFRYSKTRGAAVLSLPVTTRREDTIAKGAFGRWIVEHIGNWFNFARKLELGIEEMEDIILVTGCDLTRSWTNVAFLGGEVDAQVSFGVDVRVNGPNTNINFQLPELVRGAVIDQGPEGMNLPENQCVFLRGFRVARSFWPLPKHLKAAAGPSPDPGGYNSDCHPNTELVSTPNTKYRDPLRIVQDYIAGQVPDYDMVLIHDSDLMMIAGIGGHGTSLGTLEPDVAMDHLQRSDIQVHEVMCESSPINGPNTDMTTVKVAMLPTTFQNWNTASPSQWSPVAQNIDIGCTSGSQGMPPQVVLDSSPVPTTVQSAPMESHSFQLPIEPIMTDTTSPSQWSSPTEKNLDIWQTIESRGTPPQAVSGNLPVPSIVQNALGQPYSHKSANEPLIADTRSPFQWPPLAAQNAHIGYSSESRGAPPPAVSGGFPLPTIQDALGGSYSQPYSPHSFGLICPPNQGPNTATCSPSQDPHSGAPENTSWGQNSTGRTKKRRALLVGITYNLDSRSNLKYCTEDASSMAHFLCANFGFARHDIRLMTNEADDPWNLPTKDNILAAMRALVTDAQPGDSFLFYYSGHAKQIKDLDGDGPDGKDECICAIDHHGNVPNPNANTPGLIANNIGRCEQQRINLLNGCHLTAIFDSCHSGTALDLPYQYDLLGLFKPSIHQDSLSPLPQQTCYADVVSLSAGQGYPMAREICGGGALRCAFIECVGRIGLPLTYRELIWRVHEYFIRYGFSERPQLSTSYEINTNSVLSCTTSGETDYGESSMKAGQVNDLTSHPTLDQCWSPPMTSTFLGTRYAWNNSDGGDNGQQFK